MLHLQKMLEPSKKTKWAVLSTALFVLFKKPAITYIKRRTNRKG